jgi:ATP-dependent Lhr-like helicase
MSAIHAFHPAVQRWFASAFAAPTPAQEQAWPAIRSGRHTLVAAPTGSGKTLTAFLAALDALVREGLDAGGALPDETRVLYVSPLKALSNDIHLNLEAPLAGIRAQLAELNLPDVAIRTAVRTGDTPQRERAAARRLPPHVLVTTPESLYVLLGSESGRAALRHVRTVIVDEIHAVAASKRGSHLALTLERLQHLCARPPTRIGLSATQKPIEQVARFLVGTRNVHGDTPDCAIVDIGYTRRRDLSLELPPTPLTAVMSGDQLQQVHERIAALVRAHRTTLVFVNTRRMAERVTRHLGELLGKDAVAAHHGSLARDARLLAEKRLKAGQLQVLVATASLELGLDIGDVDLVCQIGSPRSIATFLQRAGRSGHAVGGIPKARLFPQSRDELVECAALLDAIARGELDALHLLEAPRDVLAQQIVAEIAAQDWDEDALFELVRGAWPYAHLGSGDFDAVVRMLSEGFTTRHGQRAGYVHRDAVNGRLRQRRGARMTALTSGGTIPETGDYNVVLEPQAQTIGTVNEDFAIESLAGDVFQLGNASYRILRVESGRVRVEDARGAAPNIPFWLGEAPGRTDELSQAVSRLRTQVAEAVAQGGQAAVQPMLMRQLHLEPEAARQIADYLGSAAAALGTLPSQQQLVMERFFDASGGTQLVIHSPYGSRLNRAWGLALRKRFCRTFNFELQAAATEDAIVLSLSTSHSFPLEEVWHYLKSNSALEVLIQALLDAPLFGVRWRWNATNALALPRFSGGHKTAPQLQRMKSEDLLAAVFPDQVACLENIVGEREIPDHPLVAQTLEDCLHEAMDADGWLALLRRMESGEVKLLARDLAAPSPLAAEALNAKPYAFLDDAPLEERRTQAVRSRGYTDPHGADDLGRLDPEAIAAVRIEAWPQVRDADELHEALTSLGLLTAREVSANAGWAAWLAELASAGRAAQLLGEDGAPGLWIGAERLAQFGPLYPTAKPAPAITTPRGYAVADWQPETALRELLRARLSGFGPLPAAVLAADLQLSQPDVQAALLALQADGFVIAGRFSPGAAQDEWCERHLLARIHRYTLGRLRREIEPVPVRDYARFLFQWQHVDPDTRVSGPEALAGVLAQLEGFEAQAAVWESELLSARVRDYTPSWLDELCSAGRILWTRLRPSPSASNGASSPEMKTSSPRTRGPGALQPASSSPRTRGPSALRSASVAALDAPIAKARGTGGNSLRSTPILLLPRRSAAHWTRLAPEGEGEAALGSRAQRVADYLGAHGASFFDEIADGTRLLSTELEDALSELVARGRAHCDSFGGLRALLVPASKRPSALSRKRRRVPLFGIQDAGRWALVRTRATPEAEDAEGRALIAEARRESVEHIARQLLQRHGVIAWRLLEREAAWLPPWRELVRVYQRLEARGEIRGGRFIDGLSGEQFALPEAIGLLREMRRRPHDGRMVSLSASDPANLLGSVLPGERIARVPGNRVLFRDGVPIATWVGEHFNELVPLDAAQRATALAVLSGREARLQALMSG